jgi:hypothetical protein
MTNTPPSPNRLSHPPKTPQYPPHNAPRVWFLTDGLSPIAISLSRHLLEHGDYVIAGTIPSDFEVARGEGLRNFMGEVGREGVNACEEGEEEEDEEEFVSSMALGEGKEGESEMGETVEGTGQGKMKRRKRWRDRFRVVRLDGRYVSPLQLGTWDLELIKE